MRRRTPSTGGSAAARCGAALMLLTLAATARAARAGAAGGRYLLHPDAAGDLAAARAAIAGNEFIFDVQVHYLNYDLAQPGGLGIAAAFPQQRCGDSDPRGGFAGGPRRPGVVLQG